MKSKSRVHPAYKEGTKDFDAEYNMLLDDGVTCNECIYVETCCKVFGQRPYVDKGRCQWYPNRFQAREAEKNVK